jgi:hypothetical protein
LTDIVIPDSVTSIGMCAVKGCSGLTTIAYQGTMEQWEAITKSNGWNDNTGNYVVICSDGKLNKSDNNVKE